MENYKCKRSQNRRKSSAGYRRRMQCCNLGAAKNGSVVTEIILMATIMVFIILPIFSVVIEKYILMEKARVIRDTVDVTNISAYNALTASELGKAQIDAEYSQILENFTEILSRNLKLDEGLEPEQDSIAEGRVEIMSIRIYSSGFPVVCPDGAILTGPSVHSSIKVPVRPSLYRGIILNILGKDYVDIVVHVDSEIPVNN